MAGLVTVARSIGLIALGVALLVVASWPLEILLLRSLVTGGASMKPITAVCFGLAGVSLWLQCGGADRLAVRPATSQLLARAGASVVILAGFILSMEHLLRVDGSIGNLLFPASLAATGLPNPGRTSVVTAFCFTLLGLALLLLDLETRRGHRPAQYLGLGIILFGLIGVEGYLFGMEALLRFTPYSYMALHTSMLFLMLGIGILLARPDRGLMSEITSDHVGGLMARRLLPVAVILPIVIAWPRLQGERFGLYETEVGLAIFGTSNIIVFAIVVWLSARSLNRIDRDRHQADSTTRAALAELKQSNLQLEEEIAERSRAEAAVNASEERFAVAFHASPAGMILSRLPGLEYTAVNASWLAMTDLAEDAVIGKTPDQLGLLDPDERAALFAQVKATGALRDADMRFRTAGGEARHGLVSTQVVVVNGESFLLTTLVDITARVQAETELRETNQQLATALIELRAAQQQIIEQERIGALGQLASGIAHDFNNALGPILGYSDMLLEHPELLANTEESAEYLRAINAAAEGAAGVVSRLRDFYRRRQNGDAQGPAHLPDLIAQAISLTRPRWKDQAQANGAMIDVVAEVREVPAIDGSPGELRDALVNLILNAVDALPAGGTITIRARLDGEHVTLEVTDTGIGMTEEIRRRCLEPFFTTKGDRGTGLGLGIVHGTVIRHGGVIEIDSAPGQGTTMRLRLPSRLGPEPAVSSTPPEQEARRRVLRVLVVDDEPLMRQVVERFLAIDGHSVEVAGNGREALTKLQVATFDLVITDRAMPEMGGDELAGIVKTLSPSTPVLMLTGFGDLMDAADQRPDSVDLVVPKPTTLARLRVAVARLAPEPGGDPPAKP